MILVNNRAKMNKYISISIFAILLVSTNVSACGWFIYADEPETRVYYDAFDNIQIICKAIIP